jgi:hypothetical protein
MEGKPGGARSLSHAFGNFFWRPWQRQCGHRGSTDLQPASDLSLAEASTEELTDLVGVEGRPNGSAQALAVLAGVCQAGADSFPE